MNDSPSRFDGLPLLVALLAGGLAVALLGFGVLSELTFEGPGDGPLDSAPLRPPVAPLMGPLASGASARAGQRSCQSSCASPHGVCHAPLLDPAFLAPPPCRRFPSCQGSRLFRRLGERNAPNP